MTAVTVSTQEFNVGLVNESTVTIPGKLNSGKRPAEYNLISEGFFQTVGIPLIRGRLLSVAEVDSARRVVVVNQKLARDFFGDENPLGQTIKFDIFDLWPLTPHDAYFEIVGVVGDVRNATIRSEPVPEAYFPYTITGVGGRVLFVRTSVDPLSVVSAIRKEFTSIDPGVVLDDPERFEDKLHREQVATPEFEMVVLAAFAIIGLVLAAIGVFGVMAYTVALRTNEIGIRMALGAQPANILQSVLGGVLMLVGIGAAIGLAASFALTRFLASQIWGVSPTDPWTFAAVIGIIAAVGLLACWLPARRAMRVDPMVALRYE